MNEEKVITEEQIEAWKKKHGSVYSLSLIHI